MRTDLVSFLIALLLFGFNGILAEQIALPAYEIVFWRIGIGGAVLTAIFLGKGGRCSFLRHRRSFVFLLFSGASLAVSWIFLYEAYTLLGVGLATLIYYCGPMIVMILSPVLFHEKITIGRSIGFAAAAAGIVLVFGHVAACGSLFPGITCAAPAAVMFALMMICSKKSVNIGGLENAVIQLLAGFITIAVFILLQHGTFTAVPSESYFPIFLLGAVNTGLGGYLYFSAMNRLPAQTVAVCGYLEPLAAVFFSSAILKETLFPLQIFGAVMILGGAAFGELSAAGKSPFRQTRSPQVK